MAIGLSRNGNWNNGSNVLLTNAQLQQAFQNLQHQTITVSYSLGSATYIATGGGLMPHSKFYPLRPPDEPQIAEEPPRPLSARALVTQIDGLLAAIRKAKYA